jgi:hypothetical protein
MQTKIKDASISLGDLEMAHERKTPTFKQCNRSLKALQRLFLDYPLKLIPAVIGMTGEIMVWKKLLENNLPFIPIGGQAGYDILLNKTSRNKVEVRTARYQPCKDDTKEWGWSAQKWGKRKKDSVIYDYLVCVALGDDLRIENAQFFIFTSKQIMSLKEINIPRFRNVRRRMTLYESKSAFLNDWKKDGSFFSKLEYEFNQNPSAFTEWNDLVV